MPVIKLNMETIQVLLTASGNLCDKLLRRDTGFFGGYHDRSAGRIENTLPAAEAAIAENFAIECDLQLTADGEAVVFHDDTLEQLTEAAAGPVRTRTLAELKAMALRDTGVRIPTFSELLALIDGRVPLVAELKSDWSGDRRLEERAAAVLSAYRGRVAVMSFDPNSMRAMKRLAPHLPRGLTADAFADGPDWGHLSALRRFAWGLGQHCLAGRWTIPSSSKTRIWRAACRWSLLTSTT